MPVKLWIDVLTPKQALFARALLSRAPSNFKCTLTTRDYSELNEFLKQINLRALSFGKHGGAGLREKLGASLARQQELFDFAKEGDFDLSLSFISPEASRVSFGLGVPHYICSDSPHAEAACRLAVPLSKKLFYPFPIKAGRWGQYGLKKSQLFPYHALDPWAWLSGSSEQYYKSEHSNGEKIALIRLEESFASYFQAGRGLSETLEQVVSAIPSEFQITIIPRYNEQRTWAKKRFGKRCTVPSGTVDGSALISKSSLVIGGGGTMTQEAALLGIPSVSYFPSSKLDVFENYYIPQKLCEVAYTPRELVRKTQQIAQNVSAAKRMFSARARRKVQEFADPVKFIYDNI